MADSPDVRVRLSAEGVTEVVNALKRVQAEADKAGKTGAKGIGLFNDALKDLGNLTGKIKGLLPAIGITAVVAGFTSMVKGAIQAADALDNMAEKTGATVEALSVLQAVAKKEDIAPEQLEKGLVKFAKALDELQGGSKEAVEAFQRVGLSAKDFQGLDTGTAFAKVADSMGKLKDSSGKTSVAIQLFGKSGADLIPVLNRLSDEGFESLRQKMEETGALIDSDFANAAERMGLALNSLQNQAKKTATQFAAGFAPEIALALEEVNKAVSIKGANGFKTLGKVVGDVAKGIVAAFLIVGKAVGATFAVLEENIKGLAGAGKALLTGDFAGALKLYKESAARREAIAGAFVGDVKDTVKNLFAEKATGAAVDQAKKGTVGGKTDQEAINVAQAVAKARVDFLKAAVENERKIFEAGLKLQEEQQKAAYENGLMSLKEYYQARRDTAIAALDKEIATLEDKRQAVAGGPAKTEADKIRRDQELAALSADIEVKKLERLRTEAALVQDERQAVNQLSQERLALEQKLLEGQDKRAEAMRVTLDEELRKTGELLAKQGASVEERSAILDKQATLGEANIKFMQLQEQADMAMRQLAQDRQTIQDAVAQGKLFEIQGEEKILKLEQERLPQLEHIAAQMNAIAFATGDLGKVEQVNQFNDSIRELAVTLDEAGKQMATFKKTVQDASQNALAQFFIDVSSGTKDVKDAFRDMVYSIIKTIQQMMAQMMAAMIIKALLGSAGGGMAQGGQVQKKAAGGLISGPGTDTSDSIPVFLSDGEFIVRAAVVRQPGVLQHLHSLNKGNITPHIRHSGIRRFADGGLVTAGGAAVSADSSLTVSLEPGLVLKELKTPEGQRVMVQLLSQNKRAARQAMGG